MKTPPETISTDFQKEIIDFFTNHPPAQLSLNLRRVLLDYLRYELKAGEIPVYLDEFLADVNDLFELFDLALEEEWIKKDTILKRKEIENQDDGI